jgi:hypothetical protein
MNPAEISPSDKSTMHSRRLPSLGGVGARSHSRQIYGFRAPKRLLAVIPGKRADLRLTDSKPIFYFYFDDKAAGLGRSGFGMSSVANPNQFVLLR